MITTDKTTNSGYESTTTTANTTGSYTYNGIFNYCSKLMPCGRCELTGEKCDKCPYPCPSYPWWGPYWTVGPIISNLNTVPTEYTLNTIKKE